MKAPDLQKLKLPDKPGVYFFLGPRSVAKGSGGVQPKRTGKGGSKREILYIGKATSLRDRTRSYFASDLIETRGPSIVDMVFKATTVEYQVTETVLEALILEANLIKKHQPYYNVKEKDDKSWNYICITVPRRSSAEAGQPAIPLVLTVRGKEIDFDAKTGKGYTFKSIYGPFTSGGSLKEALKIIRRIFPYVDENSLKKDNYQFYRQIGLTPEVKPGMTDRKNDALKVYLHNLKNIELFFEGKKKKILQSLKKEMMTLARREEFERAGEIKCQIFALEHINDVALIKNDSLGSPTTKSFRIEAYDIAHMSGKNMVGVMTVVEDGEVSNSEYRKFIIRSQDGANDIGALEEVLSRRFKHTEWGVPDLVVMDGGEAQLRIGKQVLKRYQLDIPVVSVVKDEHHKARAILGDEVLAKKYMKAITLANVESHRFGIAFHKQKRAKSFLK